MRIAYRNRIREFGQIVMHETECLVPKRYGDVSYSEVLVEHFGWEWRWKYSPRKSSHWHNFSKDEIGHKKYSSAHAAVSRATARLLRRGLMAAGYWCHYNLTDQGVRRCAELFPEEARPVEEAPLGALPSPFDAVACQQEALNEAYSIVENMIGAKGPQ